MLCVCWLLFMMAHLLVFYNFLYCEIISKWLVPFPPPTPHHGSLMWPRVIFCLLVPDPQKYRFVLTNIYVHFPASINLDFYPMQVTGLGIQHYGEFCFYALFHFQLPYVQDLTSILEWIWKPNSLAVSRSNNYPKVDAGLTHTLITLAFLSSLFLHPEIFLFCVWTHLWLSLTFMFNIPFLCKRGFALTRSAMLLELETFKEWTSALKY